MVKKIFGLLVLIFAMTAALVAYSMTSTVPDAQGTITGYKQKIVAKTREVAEPILKKAGIDIENTNVEDINVVERQMENATNKVNEATNSLSQ